MHASTGGPSSGIMHGHTGGPSSGIVHVHSGGAIKSLLHNACRFKCLIQSECVRSNARRVVPRLIRVLPQVY